MKKVLIGSHAAKVHFSDFREPKDKDYLYDGERKKDKETEYHDCKVGLGMQQIFDESEDIASASHLYTLKASHCFWNIHWEKTMYDILFFQNHNVPFNCELFKQLYKDWAVHHGKKKACLKRDNDKFFSDAVKRIYVHDDIHKAIAYNEKPVYEMIKEDLSQAQVSYDMFLGLPPEKQIQLCREEIYATALERFIIPKEYRIAKMAAYRGACRLLITSMTKGWFPKFLMLNWYILNRPDEHDFIGLFKQKLADGKVNYA